MNISIEDNAFVNIFKQVKGPYLNQDVQPPFLTKFPAFFWPFWPLSVDLRNQSPKLTIMKRYNGQNINYLR